MPLWKSFVINQNNIHFQVSEDKKKIRRNPGQPLPIYNEERRKELLIRTVYCKGFPVEGTTLDQLLEYFNSYGPIDNVQVMEVLVNLYLLRSYYVKNCNIVQIMFPWNFHTITS